MNLKITLTPIAIAAGLAAYVTLHPGRAYTEPRLASVNSTPIGQQASYTIDPGHTSVYFEITHLGLSKTQGRFNKVSGKIREDVRDLTKSSVEFTAQVDSLDTALPVRDEHLRAAEYFDVAHHPELTFRSTKVAKAKGGYVVTGDLTIKGTTRTVAIPFKHYGPLTLQGVGDQPPRIGVIAEPITIKRTDFGVGTNKKLPDGTPGASDEVTVRISLEATLDKHEAGGIRASAAQRPAKNRTGQTNETANAAREVDAAERPKTEQEAFLKTEPQKEHQWLQRLVGDWTFEGEASMGPEQPSTNSTGTESVRSLGNLWFLAEGQGEMPGGGPATMLMTLGYDPQKKRFVGTWIGSMMTHLWVYDGELDAAGRVLTLHAEGPSMAGGGKLAKYKDVIEFKSDDHRVLTSHVLGDDGKWQQFMTANYRRKK
jgi:polyisoprenoid-binding protein YceI